MTYKAAIFDLDGTLADTLASIAHSATMALEQLGFPALPLDNYRYYAGDGAQELMKRALAACGDTACSRLEEIMPVYAAIFEKECMYQVHPYDGIPEVLEALKQQGLKIAVLSNKPDARTHDVVRDLFGTELFDYVQGQTEKIRRKPCPDGALEIARVFDVKPEECLYCGDTNTDMQTAVAAGMFPIGVLWGFRDRQELLDNGAKVLAEVPADILKQLR